MFSAPLLRRIGPLLPLNQTIKRLKRSHDGFGSHRLRGSSVESGLLGAQQLAVQQRRLAEITLIF